jgi:hypothetical protein
VDHTSSPQQLYNLENDLTNAVVKLHWENHPVIMADNAGIIYAK